MIVALWRGSRLPGRGGTGGRLLSGMWIYLSGWANWLIAALLGVCAAVFVRWWLGRR
jgi:hypothetical protein